MSTQTVQVYKPDSVSRKQVPGLLSFIWDCRHRQPLSTYPHWLPRRYRDEQPHFQCLFGLSAHKVYPAPSVASRAVGSYPTFSPLPVSVGSLQWAVCRMTLPAGDCKLPTETGGIFSVILSVDHPSPGSRLPVRKYGALRCPDFPPPDPSGSDKTTCTA